MYKLKRLLSFVMAMLLTVSILPAQVFAVEETDGESNDEIAVAANEVTTATTDILDGKLTITYTTAGGDQGYFDPDGENAWLYAYDNEGNTEFVSTQLVITNNTEDLLNFACSLADAEASYLTIGGASAESVPSPSVEPGASLELVLNVAGGEWPELTLSDFTFSAYTESGVSFVYDANLGSITVGGASVESGYSQEVDANGVQLKAEPSADVTFLGWINAETGKLLSASATYTYKPTGENVVRAAFASADSAAWFYANNKQNLFDDLNAAVECAESANNKTVILAENGSLFKGEEDYVISSGVTLLIPYNASYTLDADVEPTITGANRQIFPDEFTQEPISASVAFRTLTVKSGATITVKGNLNVNSAVFSVGSRDTGNPHGPYGLMVLENNAELKIADGGKLYCYGFIIGTYDGNGSYTGGKVVAENAGSVYELFQIRDLGGSDRMQAKVDAFPMTQYYVQNIEAKYEILPGAISNAIISARNGITGGQQDFPFIGKDSGLFRLTAGKLTRLYDPMADRIEYTLGSTQSAGAMSVDALIIDLKGIYTVRSSDYYLAINGNLGITLESGTSATVNQRVKLLPGVKFDVAESATLTVSQSGSLTIYDSEDWKDNYVFYASENDTAITGGVTINPNNAGTARNVVRYSPSRAQVKGTISGANHGSAQLNVDGTLVAYGNVYSTSGWKAPTAERFTANTSLDNVLSGTGTYINYAAYGDVTLNEFYNNSDSSFAKVSTVPLLGNIVADGKASVTSFSNGAAEGVTYQGFYQDVNANGKAEATEYMWTDGEVASVTVKLMHGGEVAGTETMTVYSGMDLSGYFTDEACTQAAGDDFSGDTLYAKATASITRNGQELYFRSPNAAISKAWYGETVKLIDDVVLASTMEVAAGQKLTLDLNNHSISGAGDVLINNGTLDITGGATGEGITPGKLIAGGTAITNSGTIGTIGGNLEVEAKGYLLDVAAGAVVNTIGGTNGVVTMTQNNESGNYAVRVKGQIGTIGGTNANVTIKQINKRVANTATIFIDNVGGYITNIGGENATVNIIEDDQCDTAGKFRIAIWINNGHIGTLGNGGTVNIISNNLGIYYGGSTKNICYIEKVATAGTVNITGPVVDGEQTACIDAIYINTNVSENDIGILGAGGTVNINASQYGIRLSAAGADINQIATAGTVNITSGGDGIRFEKADAKINTVGAGGKLNVNAAGNAIEFAAAAKIGQIGGANSTVDLKAKAEAILVDGGGRIDAIGGENAKVTINNTIGTNNNTIYVKNGSIGTVGSTSTGLVKIDAYYRGILVMNASGNTIEKDLEAISGNVEINSTGATIFLAEDNTLDLLGGAGSRIKLNQTNGTDPAIYITKGKLNTFGYGEDCLIELNSVSKSIYLSGTTASIQTLGGENSTVIINQNLGTTNGPAYILDVYGTIDHIGGKNATVKITQISNAAQDKDNGNAKLIYVQSGAKINHIGTESGSKVLINQTVKSSGDCGWGLYVSGTVGTIGSNDSLVEIIADHSPVYLGGTLNTITGNTLMVGKRDYNDKNAFWMATGKTVGSITGGYFAQGGVTVGDGYVDYIFDANNQEKITGTADAPTGFTLSETTVKRYSEATGNTYDCLYICAAHDHSASADPVIEWITEDGQVTLRATAACAQTGCNEQVVVKSAATVTGTPEGDTYKLTYTATVSIGGKDYTETKTDELKYAGEKVMKYDDRISGTDIRIIDAGEPVETSLKVGTNERDDAVITAYGNKLVATGIGEAVAYIDNGVYEITVEKAVIDLFMVTGHSVGMGSQGNTQESVLLDNGQAYSFTVTNTKTGGYRYIDVIGETEGVGLGYGAAKRPDEVDNFTAEGGGVIGEDSGLAWQWNRMTGHKVYVVNSAVGSTSMYHWYINKSNSENPDPILDNAITNFTRARQIIQNEVDAGHFEMGTMTLINHSSANYSDSWGAIRQLYNDEDGEGWFKKVLGDITGAMNKDWDEDGTVEKASETMSVGFVPIWTRPKDEVSTSVSIGFGSDKPAVMYMGASDAYKDYFVASLIGLDRWGNDEKVQAYFKDYVQEYTAQNGQTLEVPSTNLELYPDYVHYKQFTYNEMGIDIAKNVYTRLYGNPETVSLTLMKTDGKTEVAAEGTEELNLNGSPLKLVPIVDPVSVSDLTFTAEGSMGIKWPLTLYAKDAGEGSLTISYKGTTLKTLTMNVDAVAQVGETNYVDLTEAINNAPAEGTVVLLKDLSLSTGITIAEDKNLTLDLNNHSITVAGAALTNYGTLNIMGGKAGEDKTPGALIATSGTAVVNYGHIGTIGGNLKLEGKTAIHVNHANACIDLIGGENATVTLVGTTTSNTIYIQNGTIGTIGATGTGLVKIEAKGRGILVMSVAPKADGYDLEAITGNVTITSHGGAIYVGKDTNANKGSSIGTVGGNGTITIDREAATWTAAVSDAAIHMSNGSIETIGGAGGTVNITSVKNGITLTKGSIGAIGAGGTVSVTCDGIVLDMASGTTVTTIGNREEDTTNANVTFKLEDNTTTKAKYCLNVLGTIGTIGGKNANITIQETNNVVDHSATIFINGRINTIGGENTTVNIIHNNLQTSSAKYHNALWVNTGSIGTLGLDGTVNIVSNAHGIYMGGGEATAPYIEYVAKAGTVNITGPVVDGKQTACTYGIRINTAVAEKEILELGAGGNVNIYAKTNAVSLSSTATIGSIGGAGEVTMTTTNGYTITSVGGYIGTIGGENAKVTLINDAVTSSNTVVLNLVDGGSVGTIGGENAEIILHQRGATTGIQYGILLNGTSTKTAQIEKIGDGAKFVEVIVDDCPVYLDSESEILAIEENVLLVARTVSTKDNSSSVFNGSRAKVTINGGKFGRGNSTDINAVLASENQAGKTFTKNTVDVVANADGQTYKCFVAHNHPYTATVTDPTCTEPGYTTYTCDCGDTYVAEEVAASGHTYGVPAYNWEGTELTVTLTCDKCEEGTENKVLTGNAQGEVKSSTEGDCQTKATVTYTATVTLNDVAYTNETIIDGKLGEHNLVVTEAKEATCTTPGNNVYYTCSVEGCGKVFKADKTTETTVDAETIQTTNHTPGEPVEKNRVEATATENGSYDLVVYCSVCKTHEISRKTVVIPAAGAPVEVKIDDKTKGAATITEPAGGWHYGEENTFTVTYDKSCVVVVKDADGNYTRLPASGDGNTKSYTVTLEEGMELVVAIKGDMDGNGKIRIADVIALAQAEATGDYSSYSMLIGDMDENNKIRIADVIALAQLEAQG